MCIRDRPRAGNYAKNIVAEDIVHTQTPMGLIGIKIRIAKKEKIIPEFERDEKKSVTVEDIDESNGEKIIAKTESEHIKIEEEKMKTLETLEEEEAKLK